VSESTISPPCGADPALDQRMAEHEGLVRWVVRQQWRGPLSFDDMLHAGRIGLWHALQRYDPTRGTRFSTYAVPAITRAIWDEVGAASAAAPPVCRERADRVEETDPDEALHHAQVRDVLHALVATLPPRLGEVIRARYGLDDTLPQTFAQIGKAWGMTRQRVHQLHQQALLLLAHPARSHALRLLTNHAQREAYQQTLARQHRQARAARRPRR
jgi:RNA polymerase sigma factor (sigma-70 family)